MQIYDLKSALINFRIIVKVGFLKTRYEIMISKVNYIQNSSYSIL